MPTAPLPWALRFSAAARELVARPASCPRIRACTRGGAERAAALSAKIVRRFRGRGTSVVRRLKRPCTSLSVGWKRFQHLSRRDGARTRGVSSWAYSHLHIGGPSIYPAWMLRPGCLPSSASCSGVRGGAAFSPRRIALSRMGFSPRRIALSRMGSVYTRIPFDRDRPRKK